MQNLELRYRNRNTGRIRTTKIEWLKWMVKLGLSIPTESMFESISTQFACLFAVPWWCQGCSRTQESRCLTWWHLEWVFLQNETRPSGTQPLPFVVRFVCGLDWCSTRSDSIFLLEQVLRDILKSVLSEIRILMNFTVLLHFSK